MKALARSYGEAMAALEHGGAGVRRLGLGGVGARLAAALGHGTVRWRARLAREESRGVEQGTMVAEARGRWREGRRLGFAAMSVWRWRRDRVREWRAETK